MKPLSLGIIGAANIAKDFTKAVSGSKLIAINAIASREGEKSKNFAREFNIPKSYGSYEELLKDPNIEAVYIPLPNSLHAEWAIKAAKAKKHILCEKPLAMNAQEVAAMFEAASENGVILREAYPYMAQPHFKQVQQWLNEGAIGKINHIRAAMSVLFTNSSNIRLIKEVGGGAFYDAGVYALSLILIAMGEKPKRVHALAQSDENGVDRTTMVTLEFANGTLAQVCASFSAAYTRHAMIMGDAGYIETNFANHPPMGEPPILRIKRGTAAIAPIESHPVPSHNGFLLEAEEFVQLIRTNKGWNGASKEQSLDIAKTVDAIQLSILNGVFVNVC